MNVTPSKLLGQQDFIAAMEYSPAAIFIKEAKGLKIVCWNAGCEKLFGHGASTVLGKTAKEVFPVDQAVEFEEYDQRTINSRAEVEVAEYPVTCADGKEIFVSSIRKPYFDEAGEVSLIVCTVVDISKYKETVGMLDRAQNYYLRLLNFFPNPVRRIDVSGKCDYCNTAWQKLIGTKQHKEVDSWLDSVHEDDRDRCHRQFKAAFDKKQAIQMEYRLCRADGAIIWVIEHSQPVFEQAEVFSGYLSICVDITEHKRLEDQRIKLDKLESVGVLAGGIAHDFNNYLMAIGGNISLAKMKIEQFFPLLLKSTEKMGQSVGLLEAVLTSLGSAETACDDAKSLTQKFLAFSKGGKPVIKTVPIDNLIKKIASLFLAGNNVSVKYDFNATRQVRIDVSQIEQVVQNLILNARQAMADGGKLVIKTDDFESSGNHFVKLSFIDSGPGITDENLKQIFEPWFTTKPVGQGNGLGLASAQLIVKNHRGFMEVLSELGCGTTFNVYLPAAKNIAIEIVGEQAAFPDEVGSVGSKRILLLDDDIAIINVLSEMLTQLHHQVVSCNSGVEALRIYAEALKAGRPFDLLITDLTMPGLGGHEVIEKLKKIDPDAKALISSGYGDHEAIANPQKFGFLGALVKPFKVKDLNDAINKATR